MSSHSPKTVSAKDVTLPVDHPIHKLPRLGMIAGAAGLGASIAMAFAFGATRFFGIYLVSFLFFLTLSLGGLFFVILQFATRSGWSVTVRRLAEFIMGSFVPKVGTVVVPMLAILFIPVVLGVDVLYHEWTDPAMVAKHKAVQAKVAYLNKPFFFIRMLFYFLVWTGIAKWYLSKSLSQDLDGNPETTKKLQFYSYISIAAFVLTITFASFDWIMSINPHWYSTIFGVYTFAGANVALYATLGLLIIQLRKQGYLKGIVTTEHQHSIGKMLFGFNVFWTYIAFSQFFLIWYANIPEETKWFATRLSHGWGVLTLVLVIGHFILPFFFLMSRHIKRNDKLFTIGAIWLLVMHLADLFWLVIPDLYHHKHLHLHLYDILLLVATFVGVGGFFVASLSSWMANNRLVANRDPRLPESLKMENL